MAVRITNEIHEGVYNGEPYREHERFVSGERNTASIHDDGVFLTIGGMPGIELNWDRVWDLREVLDAAIDLRHK